MNFVPGDGFLVEPNSVINSSVVSICPMVTCRSRQRIGSPGVEGVGSSLTSVAAGCGGAVAAAGVTASPEEEQAVKIISPIKVVNRKSVSFFMQE